MARPRRDAGADVPAALARLAEQNVGLHRLIESEHDLTDSKFVTFKAQLESEAKRVELALTASDKAITKSEQAYDKRFELLNELRSGVATREQLEALEKRINELGTRMDRSEGHGAGAKDNKAALYTVLGVGFTLVLVTIAVLNFVTSRN